MGVQGDNLTVEVLKWVAIALAAGFIGYFGRYFAMLIIERVRANKRRPTPPTEVAKGTAPEPPKEVPAAQAPIPEAIQLEIEKKKAKIVKKKAKAEAKKAKKKGKK
ncbi:hypothetical protein ACFLXJ_05555 [Chloroflexota bacterium]